MKKAYVLPAHPLDRQSLCIKGSSAVADVSPMSIVSWTPSWVSRPNWCGAVVLTPRSDVLGLTFAEPWCGGVAQTALPCVMLGFGSLGRLVAISPRPSSITRSGLRCVGGVRRSQDVAVHHLALGTAEGIKPCKDRRCKESLADWRGTPVSDACLGRIRCCRSM